MIKTIDIIAKEWRDKVNGNSYFSARIIIDLDARGNGKTYYIPYEYGYGTYYLQASAKMLVGTELLPDFALSCLYGYCRDNNIVLRHGITHDCKKAEVTEWGQQ